MIGGIGKKNKKKGVGLMIGGKKKVTRGLFLFG